MEKIGMNVKWSENDKKFIRENAHCMKDQEIADALTNATGRKVTLQAVRKMRQKMGVKKQPGRGICGLVEEKQIHTIKN
jgi:hypothetical protein